MTRAAPIVLVCWLLALGTGTAAADDQDLSILPPEQMSEEQLRAQLERTRALNAQLDAERKQLEEQLATMEAQVAAGKHRLDEAGLSMDEPWWRSGLADGLLVLAVLLAVGGLVGYWRHRFARKPG